MGQGGPCFLVVFTIGVCRMVDKEDLVREMLGSIGEDVSRDGLCATPRRVVKAWRELYSGYGKNPEDVFTLFDHSGHDGLVLLKGCEFISTCEHHMLPFYGRAYIGYLPSNKIVGISKLARLVDIFARRLQNQERIGDQVTDAIMEHVEARGAICVLEGRHTCMIARGVEKQNSIMVTASIRGALKEDQALRSEFYSLITPSMSAGIA